MLAALRLATNSLFARPKRTALLVGAVAMSAGLIAAVASAMASVNLAIEHRLEATVGRAELRIRPAGSGGMFSDDWLAVASSWPEIKAAVGRFQYSLPMSIERDVWVKEKTGGSGGEGSLKKKSQLLYAAVLSNGIDPEYEGSLRDIRIVEGRLPMADDEVLIDELLVQRLTGREINESTGPDAGQIAGQAASGADGEVGGGFESVSVREANRWNLEQRVRVGDTIEVRRLLRARVRLRVVGIVKPPPLGGRPQCYMTVGGLQKIAGKAGQITEIDLILAEGFEPQAVVDAHKGELDKSVLLQTTERVTSGLDKNMRSSEMGFILATVLSFLSASFIIMTGLTTNVAERQRELAMIRCIGGTRKQLAWSQLFVGFLVGAMGAGVGVPLGVGFSAAIVMIFSEALPTGLSIPAGHLIAAVIGSVVSGVLGASWPAWRAARTSPLRAMASQAEQVSRRGVVVVLIVGLAGALFQLAVVTLPRDGQVVFWAYATVGLPALFVGYFLLGVPLVVFVSWAISPVLSRVMRLPPGVLDRTIAATPYRHGFTAGAMMGGLALMISLWTTGGSVMRDWLDKMEFPDGFVSGIALTEESQQRLDAMDDIIENTCAITLHQIETDAFGVKALQKYNTTFMAFEPDRFFGMTQLTWVQGEPEEAIKRLKQGGAVIVAREFLVARGLGVGDTFTARHDEKEYKFEVVGVVTSPGLDIISKFFNIGEDYTQQSLHAVFGSRKDLKEKFASEAIHLIQIDFKEGVDDEAAVDRIRRELFDAGILDAGSGRRIKKEIKGFIGGTLYVFSAVAMAAMLVACFGVANLIVAGIDARRYEFGVLRAIGAQQGMLVRLVLGETIVIALVACVLGTLMGFQGAYAARRMYELLLGLLLGFRLPMGAITAGWGIVFMMTIAAATPAMLRLNRMKPRELLQSS